VRINHITTFRLFKRKWKLTVINTSLCMLYSSRIQTSYVSVEPKKRREYGPTSNVGEKSQGSPQTETGATAATTEAPETIEPSLPAATALGYSEVEQPVVSTVDSSSSATAGKAKSSSGTLRRARIVITVKRTDAYKKWLLDNPIHDIHAGHDDDHIIT
jgi:hypothetical protein